MEMQRQAKIADLEEIDDHEAAEDDKMKKKISVGRPKKGRSQLLAEVAKMIRDRVRQIFETKSKLLISVAGVMEDGMKQLGAFPPDLKAIQEQMNKEIAECIPKIDAVATEIKGLDPEKLVTDCSEDAEALRKALVGKSADVFKAHIPEISRSLNAFKGALKHAIKEKNKKVHKNKGMQTGGAIETPVMTKTLKELVAKNTDAFKHVEVITDAMEIEKIQDISSQVRLLTFPEAFKKVISESPGVAGHLKWMRKQLQKELREMP
jgi:hypothetical protein